MHDLRKRHCPISKDLTIDVREIALVKAKRAQAKLSGNPVVGRPV
jgi:hypothetical protein